MIIILGSTIKGTYQICICGNFKLTPLSVVLTVIFFFFLVKSNHILDMYENRSSKNLTCKIISHYETIQHHQLLSRLSMRTPDNIIQQS